MKGRDCSHKDGTCVLYSRLVQSVEIRACEPSVSRVSSYKW